MTKEILTMGPWMDGVNTITPSSLLVSSELTEAKNVELDERGQLRGRRPFIDIHEYDSETAATRRILGEVPISFSYDDGSGPKDYNGTGIIFIEVVGTSTTYDLNIAYLAPVVNQVQIKTLDTFNDTLYPNLWVAAFAYDGRYYILSGNPLADSYYSDGTDLDNMTFTAITTGPQTDGKLYGSTYIIFLDRLYVAEGDTVHFSTAYDFLDWRYPPDSSSGFFTIGSRLGEDIKFFHVMYGALYIFTPYNTYQFSFNTSPNEDAAILQVSNQGAIMGIYHNDRLFVVSADGLYIFINNIFYKQELKGSIDYLRATGIAGLDTKILLIIQNVIHCIDMRTGGYTILNRAIDQSAYDAWATNIITTNNDQMLTYAINDTTRLASSMIALESSARDVISLLYYFYELEIDDNLFDVEILLGANRYRPYVMQFKTKRYDYGANFLYKRIYFATAEMESKGDEQGIVYAEDDLGNRTRVTVNTTVPVKFRYIANRRRDASLKLIFRPSPSPWDVDSEYLSATTTPYPCFFSVSSLGIVYEPTRIQRGELT